MTQTVTIEALERLLSGLPGHQRVVVSGNLATPAAAVSLVERSIESVTLNALNAIRDMPTRREGIILETPFVGPGMRGKPNLRYLPCRLSMVPLLFRHDVTPDVVMIHTSLPAEGKVSLGIEVNTLPAAIDAARTVGGIVIAFMNPAMPYTYGDGEIDLADIDFLVEIDEPLLEASQPCHNETARAIGETISTHIHDGSTLQLGIGAIPDAVLAHVNARSIRIWTETFSDGVIELQRRGLLADDVPLRTSFLIGSRELYDWADCNRSVQMLRTEVCNDPARIAQNYAMISVNAALQVDLFGQANASRLNDRIYSGFGGSTDFIVGAMHAVRGHSFMALPSWHPKANVSTIVDMLAVPATSFQQNAIVTEQGIAWLFGVDEKQQAMNIIDHAAHPAAREHLLGRMRELWN